VKVPVRVYLVVFQHEVEVEVEATATATGTGTVTLTLTVKPSDIIRRGELIAALGEAAARCHPLLSRYMNTRFVYVCFFFAILLAYV